MDTRTLIDKLTGGGDPTTFSLKTVETVVTNLRFSLIAFAAFEAIIGLLLVAMNYFTAYGDEAKAQKAKTRILWIVVGTIVVILSEVLLYEVFNYFVPAYENQVPQIEDSINPFTTP
jgi:hypothetical protein